MFPRAILEARLALFSALSYSSLEKRREENLFFAFTLCLSLQLQQKGQIYARQKPVLEDDFFYGSYVAGVLLEP